MPKLNCSAATCAYNDSNCCCINAIHVGGSLATKESGTCCDSFQHKNMAFTNDIKDPKINVYVHCKAHNCVYNSANECTADSVNIEGFSACQCDETNCSSFSPK